MLRLKVALGCHDHDMVKFQILRGRRKAKSKITTLDFRRADLELLSYILKRVP